MMYFTFDLPFLTTGYESLAGILDIVVSIPGHIDILPDYSTNTLSTLIH